MMRSYLQHKGPLKILIFWLIVGLLCWWAIILIVQRYIEWSMGA